ncbi:hypothetical protein SAMN02745126_05578 [Enhydrobacter aerosaccus]|uniref:Uncharacterized protein n=1 Tax=Enhydrobacter aerosaccus TaxID=225324 RepID=A0A1T4T392_9HYPH|nr:hypothetical protein [Enhydrobacter aerosaccus]SKA34922.1 hypothetical protein SAMN02745126_05578 [Enhydrobacter aerosaccus]
MTKLLPALVVAGTVLITTAIVNLSYALFWLASSAADTAPTYDWGGALFASAIASMVVLLASALAQDLVERQAIRVPVRVRRLPRR